MVAFQFRSNDTQGSIFTCDPNLESWLEEAEEAVAEIRQATKVVVDYNFLGFKLLRYPRVSLYVVNPDGTPWRGVTHWYLALPDHTFPYNNEGSPTQRVRRRELLLSKDMPEVRALWSTLARHMFDVPVNTLSSKSTHTTWTLWGQESMP